MNGVCKPRPVKPQKAPRFQRLASVVVGPEGLSIVSLFNGPGGQTVENPVPRPLALRAGVKPLETPKTPKAPRPGEGTRG